jgi:hypothetical protein
MVALLALVPPLVAAALLVGEATLPGDLIVPLASSWPVYVGLSAVMLAAILVAAWGRRDSAVLGSAWLFLFCGMVMLSLSELVELLGSQGGSWVSDLFEIAAFFPLLIYTGYVAAPLRILVVGRRRRTLYAILAASLIVLVALLTIAPWLRPGPGAHGGPRLLRVLKPELDAVLLLPVALMLLALGAARRAYPYLFVGLGLLVMLPTDLLSHYHLANGLAIEEELAALLSLVWQLYVLIGAAVCAVARMKQADRLDEASAEKAALP